MAAQSSREPSQYSKRSSRSQRRGRLPRAHAAEDRLSEARAIREQPPPQQHPWADSRQSAGRSTASSLISRLGKHSDRPLSPVLDEEAVVRRSASSAAGAASGMTPTRLSRNFGPPRLGYERQEEAAADFGPRAEAEAGGTRVSRRSASRQRRSGADVAAPASTPPRPTRSKDTDDRPHRTLEMAIALGVFFCVATLVVAFVVRAWLPYGARSDPFCHSDACLGHMRLLEARLDRGVDPCVDFDAYACSRWQQASEFYGYASASTNVLLDNWFNNFPSTLSKSLQLIPTTVKLQAMFKACMTSISGLQGAPLRMLKAFMRERKIPWPDEPLPDATPLGVLLDFALNWAVDLWFDVRMLRNSRGTMGIVLAPGNFFMLWGKLLRDSVPSDQYLEYWNGFYAAFAVSGGTAASKIRRIADIEQDVVTTLSSAFERQSTLPLRFSLQDIAKYTSKIPTSEWIEAFEANVHLLPDHVGVSDIALLEAVNKLFAKYNRTDLLHHLSWFFVQVFAPFGDVVSNVPSIDDERAAKQRQVFCVTQAEAAYRVLVAALYLQPLLAAEQKRALEGHFDSIRRVTVQKIANVSWSDNLSKYMATVKLQQLQTFLWPPSDMLIASGLSYLYADFASNASTAIEFWRDAHEHVRALRDKSYYGTPMTKLPAASSPPLVRYDYLRNAVVLSVAALSAPLYASQATPAMLHGGLMFSYAREVVRALDRTGMKVDPYGDVAAKWASSNWEKGVARKYSCLAPTYSSPFPEIPALEVAHEAFEIALSSAATRGKAWRTTDAFSEHQVFFISACFTLCRLNRTAAFLRGDCNKAFSNSRQFADAFGCVPGSPMNPLKKCTFFD